MIMLNKHYQQTIYTIATINKNKTQKNTFNRTSNVSYEHYVDKYPRVAKT